MEENGGGRGGANVYPIYGQVLMGAHETGCGCQPIAILRYHHTKWGGGGGWKIYTINRSTYEGRRGEGGVFIPHYEHPSLDMDTFGRK